LFSTSILTAHPDPVNAVTFDTGDTAWMIVNHDPRQASCLYGGMVGKKKCHQHNATKLHGYDHCNDTWVNN
jgi:hypothetical protein